VVKIYQKPRKVIPETEEFIFYKLSHIPSKANNSYNINIKKNSDDNKITDKKTDICNGWYNSKNNHMFEKMELVELEEDEQEYDKKLCLYDKNSISKFLSDGGISQPDPELQSDKNFPKLNLKPKIVVEYTTTNNVHFMYTAGEYLINSNRERLIYYGAKKIANKEMPGYQKLVNFLYFSIPATILIVLRP
jgi:hypothetical protein